MLGLVGRTPVATVVSCDNLDGFAHWYVPETGVTWYLRSTDASREGALTAALATWTDVPTTGHTLLYGGTRSVTTPRIDANDRINLVFWGSHPWCGGNSSCLAITTFSTSGTFEPRYIVEADIMFNQSHNWTTGFDVQAVATHELGHSLGIAHTELTGTPRPTMYAEYFGTDGRTLENDDRAALQCSEDWYVTPSYFGQHWDTNCRAIRGQAWNSKRPNGTTWVQVRDGGSIIDKFHTSGPAGNHTFSYRPSSYFRDGKYHTINLNHWWRGNVWLAGTGQSLICQVPGFPYITPNEFLSTGGVPYSVGNIFRSNIPGYVTHLRYYKAAEETSGWHELSLWTENGQHLESVWVDFPAWDGWVEGKLYSDGYPIDANTNYVVSVTTYTKQSKTSCGFSSPITNGPLTFHGGLWKEGDRVFPDTGSCSNFWTDVYFDQ